MAEGAEKAYALVFGLQLLGTVAVALDPLPHRGAASGTGKVSDRVDEGVAQLIGAAPTGEWMSLT